MLLDTYYKLRSQIKTGDVIAFSDKSIANKVIECVTKGDIAHVGLAVWINTNMDIPDRLFIIESTGFENNPDINGQYRYGVQTLPLSQRLYNYDGEVFWVELKEPLIDAEQKIMLTWLFNLENKKVTYGLGQAISAGYHQLKNPLIKILLWPFVGWWHERSDLHSIFCSQMDSQALQLVDRIPTQVDPSLVTPKDLVAMPCFCPMVKIFGKGCN